MHSIFKLSCLFIVLCIFSSCKKDNETPANFISYDGKTYSVTSGVYADDFLDAFLNPEESDKKTHHKRVFILSDGDFSEDQFVDLDSFIVNASYSLMLELYTPVYESGSLDMDGEYRYENWFNLMFNDDEINYEGEYLFGLTLLQIDANDNGLIDDFDDHIYVNDGSLSLTQEGHHFEMELNGNASSEPISEGNVKIKMKYSGLLRFENE